MDPISILSGVSSLFQLFQLSIDVCQACQVLPPRFRVVADELEKFTSVLEQATARLDFAAPPQTETGILGERKILDFGDIIDASRKTLEELQGLTQKVKQRTKEGWCQQSGRMAVADYLCDERILAISQSFRQSVICLKELVARFGEQRQSEESQQNDAMRRKWDHIAGHCPKLGNPFRNSGWYASDPDTTNNESGSGDSCLCRLSGAAYPCKTSSSGDCALRHTISVCEGTSLRDEYLDSMDVLYPVPVMYDEGCAVDANTVSVLKPRFVGDRSLKPDRKHPQCGHCGGGFKRRADLLRHTRVAHYGYEHRYDLFVLDHCGQYGRTGYPKINRLPDDIAPYHDKGWHDCGDMVSDRGTDDSSSTTSQMVCDDASTTNTRDEALDELTRAIIKRIGIPAATLVEHDTRYPKTAAKIVAN